MKQNLEGNYRGIRPANIVTVLEGKGTEESPYRNVEYVVAYENISGFSRMVTVGKIIPISENFGDNYQNTTRQGVR